MCIFTLFYNVTVTLSITRKLSVIKFEMFNFCYFLNITILILHINSKLKINNNLYDLINRYFSSRDFFLVFIQANILCLVSTNLYNKVILDI